MPTILSFKEFLKEAFSLSHRNKLASARRGKKQSAETKAKISRSMAGQSNFAGKRHTKGDKIKIQLARGHDDRIDGKKWVVDKHSGKTYRKDRLPNTSDYSYGREVKRGSEG